MDSVKRYFAKRLEDLDTEQTISAYGLSVPLISEKDYAALKELADKLAEALENLSAEAYHAGAVYCMGKSCELCNANNVLADYRGSCEADQKA